MLHAIGTRPASSVDGAVPTAAASSATVRAMTTSELRAADREALWHPFTQQQGWSAEDAPIIERGEGCDLYDTDGNAYIDGVSSLWCNVHGHRHPAIDAAVRAQLDRVAHTTMLGLSHPPARSSWPSGCSRSRPGDRELTRVFYSDNGSTANEIALKMAFQFWHASAATSSAPSSCTWTTATTATRSARSRSAASTSSTRSTGRCCSSDRRPARRRRGPGARSSPSAATRSPR